MTLNSKETVEPQKGKEYWEGVYSFDWKEVTMTYDFAGRFLQTSQM